MRIAAVQAKEIAPLVHLAVQRQIECWKYETQIEKSVGVYFKNLEQAIADLAAAGDPETISDEDVLVLIRGLKVER